MPRLVTAAVAVAAVAALAVVLTRPGGGSSGQAGGEVFLQSAAASGPDPFTESTAARQATPPPQSPAPSQSAGTAAATASGTTATRSVSGSAPGLYGGTRDVASCDVEKQIGALSGQPAKNSAFASALGVEPAAVPGYLRGLTPVQLRLDTRVTNHGYRDGAPTAYQAVLQAGTPVLVDDRGVPRVRCACGNPLGPPVALKANPKRYGEPWAAYQPSKVVVIAPSETTVNAFVIYDHQDRRWLERGRGASPKPDKPVPPPPVTTPVPTVSTTAAPATPTPPATSSAPPTPKPTAPPTPKPTGPATKTPPATETAPATETPHGTPTETAEPPSATATEEPYPPAPATPPATTPPAPTPPAPTPPPANPPVNPY
ncbi:hypothetical protein EDD96_5911 [Streptomyces sp. Ag109_G2-6]|uniref:DUF6777 domain-containing protein n=1 Tax=Streptomyces TaxID=1883 RepID=UPI000FAE999F|nr:DUF6777 domain-containing protein [Streptomyces katrae]RPF29391.1 hypothetical protein EDD96_5911 [Streptomyces sp. Ag109_G2-6]